MDSRASTASSGTRKRSRTESGASRKSRRVNSPRASRPRGSQEEAPSSADDELPDTYATRYRSANAVLQRLALDFEADDRSSPRARDLREITIPPPLQQRVDDVVRAALEGEDTREQVAEIGELYGSAYALYQASRESQAASPPGSASARDEPEAD